MITPVCRCGENDVNEIMTPAWDILSGRKAENGTQCAEP